MSRVHQAIRKAEKETRKESAAAKPPGRSLFQSTLNVQPGVLIEGAPTPTASGGAEEGLAPRLEPAKTGLSVLHDARLVALSASKSLAGEQYRTLKTKLFQMRNSISLRTVLVTSAAASDGKTLTAVNLALTIAQEIEQRVLLIDCDLRRPSVHRTLGLPKTTGLADFLGQDLAASNIVFATSISNLWVVPAGTVPQNPAELLNTQKMRDFFSSVSQQFDWVIVDSPPIVPLADAELLSSFVDGTLLVVRASKTPAESITKAVQTLKSGRVLGVVFNATQASKKSSYYYYSYGSNS